MWVSAFLGMATKFAESTLAVRFRSADPDGEAMGGTMYMIRSGLSRKLEPMAKCYALFGLLAAFGVGNTTQVNAVISALNGAGEQFGFTLSPVSCAGIGLVLGLAVYFLVSGGAEKIGAAAECLVPVAAGAYIMVCVASLWLKREFLPDAIRAIFCGAFSPRSVTGGMVGSLAQTLTVGVSRGVFTNEAGMGTAAMSHAGAQVAHPVEQGLMGIMEVFMDTILICTLTALVILTSGVSLPYGQDAGAELTARALSADLGPWTGAFLCACLCLFALATILGWGLYAGRCAEFLLGMMNWPLFALGQGVCVLLGTLLDTDLIWSLSELMNGLMALPNLITLLLLLPELRRLTIDYPIHKLRGPSAAGGTYENFHQRKPLPALSHEKIPPLCRGSGEQGQKNLSSEHRSA